MPEPKRVNKTKEELEAELKQEQEVRRQRAIVRDKIYPILLSGSTSIANANQMLQILLMTLRQASNSQMVKFRVSDLELLSKIDPKAPQVGAYKEIVGTLLDENVLTAMTLIEGMGHEVDRLITKELHERPFKSLPTDFIEDGTVQTGVESSAK